MRREKEMRGLEQLYSIYDEQKVRDGDEVREGDEEPGAALLHLRRAEGER